MELVESVRPDVLAAIGFLFYMAGFAVRDELLLRALIAAGTTVYILYYYTVAGTPLWGALSTNIAVLIINLVLIGVILRERTTFGMSREMESLYKTLPTLNPGQFRRVMKAGEMHLATGREVLIRRGETIPGLILVADGTMELERQNKVTPIPAGNFIGEISFLVGGPASATVAARPGTRYVLWDIDRLRRMLDRSPALSNAFNAAFNRDLARKLAVSAPE